MASAKPVRCMVSVEHRTGIAEVMGSNPRSLSLLLLVLLSCCLADSIAVVLGDLLCLLKFMSRSLVPNFRKMHHVEIARSLNSRNVVFGGTLNVVII